jgi:hypothetical protein
MAFIIVLSSISLFSQCDLRSELQSNYRSLIGVKELTGNNDGKQVAAIIEASGFDSTSRIPWCAAYVYYEFLLIDHRLEVKYPAYAPSYFPDNRIIYTRGQKAECTPLKGDIIGIYFRSKKRIAHVGFYDGENEKYIITVEGNTNKAGSREGDGVWVKYRPKKSIYKISRFL